VDFVDEQHVARRQIRHDAKQIARLFNRRARRRPHLHAELVANHIRQRRLAETRRTVQQHVIQRVAALLRSSDRDEQVFTNAILADVVVENARAQPGFVLRLFFYRRGGDDSGISAHW
jgi:hypothetical protein